MDPSVSSGASLSLIVWTPPSNPGLSLAILDGSLEASLMESSLAEEQASLGVLPQASLAGSSEVPV